MVVSVVESMELMSVGMPPKLTLLLALLPSVPGISGVMGSFPSLTLAEDLSMGGSAGSAFTGALALVSADIIC